MIRLHRDRTAVPDPFRAPQTHARVTELFRAAMEGKLSDKLLKKKLFNSSRWSGAKEQLGFETKGKCAFCEAPTSATYYGDVEHFRPKAVYWWLAYCYDNYLYSCRVCNGSKGEKHRYSGTLLPAPAIQAGMTDEALLQLAAAAAPSPDNETAVTQLEALCLAELGDLPNPYNEDPEPLFEWVADDELKEVTIGPASQDPRSQQAYRGVKDIVRLNRPELRTQRWQLYDLARRLRDQSELLPVDQRPGLHEIIRSMGKRDLPFSAMIRFFVRQWGL